MNELAQFLYYTNKVYALPKLLRGVRDQRLYPQIPLQPVLLTLLLGVVLRVSSYLDLAAQTLRRRWRRLVGASGPISHDTFGYVTERLEPEDLRRTISSVNRTLKTNKNLDQAKIHGLHFLSLDANEHFSSRSRCCDRCCQRQIKIKDAQGQIQEVTEYYHRNVFAHRGGPQFNMLVDLEPIRPGEDESQSALRLLGRFRRVEGVRSVDVVTVDGWYAKGPFLRAIEKLGWEWVVVLKQERLEVFREARQLLALEPPGPQFQDEQRQREVQLSEVKGLPFSEGYGKTVRVVRSQERWVEKKVVGGRKVRRQQQSQWWWMASAGLDAYPSQVIYRGGHRRWGIENEAFNQLTQFYHLEHCYHHEPGAMLVQMLILMLGFTLFTAFAKLHRKVVRLEKVSLKDLAHQLDLALVEDLPWEQWFACG